jgi:hypothetical protein
VFIDLLKELIPASNELALSLVLDKFKLILSPAFLNVPEELFKDKFSACLS